MSIRDLMSTAQCNICFLYSCEHKVEREQQIKPMDLGDQIGVKLTDVKNVTTINIKNPDVNITCIECRAEVSSNAFCTNCGVSLIGIRISEPIKEPEIIKQPEMKNSKSDDKIKDLTIKCNYCDLVIIKKYLDAHLKMHIDNFVAEPEEKISLAQNNITSINTNPAQQPAILKLVEKLSAGLTDKDDISLKEVVRFKYREIDNVSVSASSSKDQRFSDFTATVWLKERTGAYSTGYAGGSYLASKDFERVVIHTTFDAIDEYYSVSVKLLKQNQYSSYDVEEAVPERLCFDQTEISSEIKKALLFFKIPPRSVYKRFLKTIRSQEFLIERDDDGRIEYVQTENTNDLVSALKEKQSFGKDNDHWGMHG